MPTHGNEVFMNYVKVIRWPNLLIMAGVMVCLRYFLILPQFDKVEILAGTTFSLFLLFVAGVLAIAAGGYVINDIFDQEIDAINHPGSQIVGAKMTLFHANLYYVVLTAFGVCVGIYLAWLTSRIYFGMIFVTMAALLYYYSKRYKRQLLSGNIVVSIATALVLIIVWNFELFMLDTENAQSAVDSGITPYISKMVYAYTFFAFIVSLIREIVKDMEDVTGDAAYNCATIPILLGIARTKKIVSVLIVLLMAMVAYWQYWLWTNSFQIGAVFLFSTQMIALILLVKMFSTAKTSDWHQFSNLTKMLMISGIASIILLKYVS